MDMDTFEGNEQLPPTSPHDNSQVVPEQMMNGDEDPYKPEGKLQLKIEKLSEFAREGTDSRRFSDAVYIRGLPWKILAIPRDFGRRTQMGPQQKYLGYFLQCNADNTDPAWSCTGSATLKILAQKEGKEDHVRKISHVFHAKENDWGFAQLMTFECLMDPESGWYSEESDTIILAVDVTADAPHGVNWDSKKDTGCIGLKNQGATCYMNSILQTLFFTNKLRKAVYQMPIEDDNPDSSVALAMQRVFYELQFSDSPVGTKKLNKSFGWDSIDSFLQHDVQEFCRVLLDNLENKMKNTKVVDTIPSLFKGRMKSYLKCKEVDFESSHEECFYDVQLNVKNKSNVLESFKGYIEPEILDGENKYDAGEFGLQPAEKGLKFLSFPPVLHLQLMRFQYDPQSDANVKINDKYEFPDVLDLSEFVDARGEEEDKEEFLYLLHAVLVHSGDFHGGHYVAFININLGGSQKWCKFDDDVVSRVAHRDAVMANFGGENTEGVGRAFTNAYMLVYIKKNAIDDVLHPVSAEDIPGHLKVRFENEKRRELERRQEREEASNFCEIMLILDEEMREHHEFDLFDVNAPEIQKRKMKVQKDMTYKELYKYVADNMKYEHDSFRLWDFKDQDDDDHLSRCNGSEVNRPRSFISPDAQKRVHRNRMIYLETGKTAGPDGVCRLSEYDPEGDIIAFMKFYNHLDQITEYRGTLIMENAAELSDYFEEINMAIGMPISTRLNIYIEYKPDEIFPIIKSNMKIYKSNKMMYERWCGDGMILIVEVSNETTETSNAHVYFRNLYNRIYVEAYLHDFISATNGSRMTPAHPIKGEIGLDWNIPRLCAWLADELNCDLEKILPWKVTQPSEKPFIYLSSEQYRQYKVIDLINIDPTSYDPCKKRVYKIIFTLLPFKFFDLEQRKHMNIQMLYAHFQISDIIVFPRKHGTVKDILDYASEQFRYSPNGTGLLRLVYVYSSANASRLFHVLNQDQPYDEIIQRNTSSAYKFRVEEIPKDQVEIGPDEFLFPIAHFDKDPSRMFGVPFFIKISARDDLAELRQRIKQALHVSEKEFEKYKLHMVVNNKVVKDLDEDDDSANGSRSTIENLCKYLSDNKRQPLNTSAYIGIDHFNKMRAGRGGLMEKPIIIHN